MNLTDLLGSDGRRHFEEQRGYFEKQRGYFENPCSEKANAFTLS
jgi:hypothetical protein